MTLCRGGALSFAAGLFWSGSACSCYIFGISCVWLYCLRGLWSRRANSRVRPMGSAGRNEALEKKKGCRCFTRYATCFPLHGRSPCSDHACGRHAGICGYVHCLGSCDCDGRSDLIRVFLSWSYAFASRPLHSISRFGGAGLARRCLLSFVLESTAASTLFGATGVRKL